MFNFLYALSLTKGCVMIKTGLLSRKRMQRVGLANLSYLISQTRYLCCNQNLYLSIS